MTPKSILEGISNDVVKIWPKVIFLHLDILLLYSPAQ